MSAIVSKHGDWISARVGDEIVMMSAEMGEYIGLNAVGVAIWDLIDAPKSVEEIERALLAEFDVSEETCRVEVQAFLAELAERKAIELRPSPEG